MCTVTAIPLADRGFRLMCNRDEQWSRPVASAPAVVRAGRYDAIYPTDLLGGGTWTGANSAGLALAVLNRYEQDSSRDAGRTLESRGRIAVDFLRCGRLEEVIESAQRLAADRFAPFRLVVLHKQHAVTVSSNGCVIDVSTGRLTAPFLLTSSSLGDVRVDSPRRALFEQLTGARPERWVAAQAQFHRHQWPDGPAFSVVMARADAGTVSRSTIDVSARGVRFHYEPLPIQRRAAAA